MRKFLIVVVDVFILGFFISCTSNSNLMIKKVVTKNCIDFEFENLNLVRDSTLDLDEGDTIETSVYIEKGEISVKVEGDNGEIPYKCSNVRNGDFSFIVTKKGTYTFTLLGEKANGNISFKKEDEDNSKS